MGEPERDHNRVIEDHGRWGWGSMQKGREQEGEEGDKWKRKAKTRNMMTSLPTGEKEDWDLPDLSVTCPIWGKETLTPPWAPEERAYSRV